MIRVFYGENREQAYKFAKKQLGANYEVIEAESLTANDMASVFLGVSLFGDGRAILVKDLSQNKECWEKLENFTAECPHNVVLLESKVDKRSVAYKALAKDKNVEFKEFKFAEPVDKFAAFDVFDKAFRGDGSGALKQCEKIIETNDPFMLMGLMVSQASKKLQLNNPRAQKVMKILSSTDIKLKTTKVDPWSLIKIALLEIASIK